MTMQATIPARRILTNAEETNQRLGHENLGSLSASHGFLSVEPPLRRLPSAYQTWDEIAERLPELYHTFALRKVMDAMPLLDADVASLPDRYLMRAVTMLSSFAHAYHWIDAGSSDQLPLAIQQPWETISQRLGRRGLVMTFIEVHSYNWRLLDPTLPTPRRLDNMRLLFPIFDVEDEHVFSLTPVEMLDTSAPAIGAVVRAQEAVQRDDPDALVQELAHLLACLHKTTYESFTKINLNPYSSTHVDPVVWAKTFAVFGLPIPAEVAQGAGGAASPLFHLLDSFFERKIYTSTVGCETLQLRSWFPPHWQAFLKAVGQISVQDYVQRVGDSTLTGVFQETFNAFAGENGLLGRHRLKVYPYISLAFKAGRGTTSGGSFAGTLKERMWDKINQELETTRNERDTPFPTHSHQARIKRVVALDAAQRAKQIVLDVSGTGIRYQPGDHLTILPEQSDALVTKTVRALQAGGEEPVQLNDTWRKAVALRRGDQGVDILPLHTLLRFGRIRPVDRTMVQLLYAMTHNAQLHQIMKDGREDRWELWDLIDLLAESGFNPQILWQAPPGAREHICCIVSPESFRTYSISSTMHDPQAESASEVHLTVGQLHYQTKDASETAAERRGTGSSFLGDGAKGSVAFQIERPARFTIPRDPHVPIVMFAGGTGFAPFRGFIQARAQQEGGGENWLFWGTRSRDEFYYQDELAQFAAQNKLHVRVAFSDEDIQARFQVDETGGSFVFPPGKRGYIDAEMLDEENARLLWELMRSPQEGGRGAHLYICGRTDFADTVLAALRAVISRFIDGPPEDKEIAARQFIYRLVGEGRLNQDVFTTYTCPEKFRTTFQTTEMGQNFSGGLDVTPTSATTQFYNVSDVVLHNDDDHGYWLVLDGRVYDLTEFAHLHPGGFKIIRSYARLDGSDAFQKVGHHADPRVMAMLRAFQIGELREPALGAAWGVGVAPDGLRPISLRNVYQAWIRFLYHIVEMENALYNTFDFQHRIPLPDTVDSEHSIFTLSQVVGFHDLFMQQYIPGIMGQDVEDLWALTAGLCAPQRDARWMQEQNEYKAQSTIAESVGHLTQIFKSTLKAITDGELCPNNSTVAQTVLQCQQLEAEEKRFMHEIKLTVRAGVRVFETFESRAIEHGGEVLLRAIAALPHMLETFYQRAMTIRQQVPTYVAVEQHSDCPISARTMTRTDITSLSEKFRPGCPLGVRV